MSIDRIIAYIIVNLGKICGPECVAKALGMKIETLRRRFRRHMLIPIGRFIRDRRIELMKHLLATSDLMCCEISNRAGFLRDDTAHKVFKRQTGMTMQEWRKIHQRQYSHSVSNGIIRANSEALTTELGPIYYRLAPSQKEVRRKRKAASNDCRTEPRARA
jgi:AraC-like DNA-binding protein